MTYQIQVLIDAKASLGEGPRWRAGERRLYWVDIDKCELHRTDPESGADEVRTFDTPVGCFAFRRGGGMVLAMQTGFARIDSWGDDPRPFGPQPLAERPALRFNDGTVDPGGRFFAGALTSDKAHPDAALYRLDRDGTLVEVAGGMTTCNGAAFNADGTRFYHADTPSHALRVYDADPATGDLSNARIFHQWPHGNGRPDGGSVDAEGCYWSALWDGGRIVRLSPEGKILAEVPIPASRPTMITFGGDDLRTAFVTSARGGLDAAALAQQPHAGAVFTFRVDVPGLPANDFAG
jgi:sugar lactone lactonase YvrE